MENVVDKTVETVRKPRKLLGTDIFLLVSIISKVGVRNIMRCFDLKEMQEEKMQENEENAEVLGQMIFYAILDMIIDKLEACESPICKLLGRLYGMEEDEVRNIYANEWLDMFIDVVKDENFADFFKRAYESVKRMM